jgi:hypothetical protein
MVKNKKVNALFDGDSQCNLISVGLVDELGHGYLYVSNPNSLTNVAKMKLH